MDITNKYAMLIKSTRLWEFNKEKKKSQPDKWIKMNPGTLLKLSKYTPNNIAKRQGCCLVQLFDEMRQCSDAKLYVCPKGDLKMVDKHLWPYMLSVPMGRRVGLFNDQKHCQWLMSLQKTSIVAVKGALINHGKNEQYVCIIRYIGPVEEYSSVGFVFGLELLNIDVGISPQSEFIPYSIKYMELTPDLSIFAAPDALYELSDDLNKKLSTSKLIADTIRLLLGSNICLSDHSEKRAKESSSTFYTSNGDDVAESPTQTHTLVKRTPSPPNSDDFSMGKDEFTRKVNKYEAKLIADATAKFQPLAGILKTSNARTASFSGKEHSLLTSKPPAIHSLEGRDLVVIDDSELQELKKQEPDVFLLENPPQQQADLADVLGQDWPGTAGDLGNILNRSRKNQHTTTKPNSINKIDNDCIGFGPKKPDNAKAQHLPKKKNAINTEKDKHLTTQQDKAGIFNEALNNLEETPIQSWDEVPNTNLGVDSLVEVSLPDVPQCLYGVIRWVNVPPGESSVLVGVELEEPQNDARLMTTNGAYKGMQLFQCNERRAIFVAPEYCMSDRRFVEAEGGAVGGSWGETANAAMQHDSKMFGQVACPTVPGAVAPIKVNSVEELAELCGKFKGIQGHHNSCYLDATLFAMYAFTSVFDSVLFRPPNNKDIPLYAEVQKVLREEIVNPLRTNMFVRADRVLKLRQFMDRLSSVSGLMSEEKDPEEFLNSLLAQIMRAEPFLKLSSGQDSYFYQLFVEKDEHLTFPSVQQLFEQSFHSSDIKLKEVPSCLIIQMPRFGKDFKMYPRILPSQLLDITDILENGPRQCTICGELADFECRDCFGVLHVGSGLENTAYCSTCLEKMHMHQERQNHTFKKLKVPPDFRNMAEKISIPHVYMELFAVVCIETSHYVSFVKAGSGPDAPWCFFDSMADRKGEINGYNIPEMMTVPDLPHWLSDEGSSEINESTSNDKMLTNHAKRLFCDAYLCMYQNTDVMMYR